MLLSRDAIATAMERCAAADFYRPSHAQIFQAITMLYARGEPADAVTVAEELRRSGALEEVGDTAALVGLQSNTPSIASAARYAGIVEELSLLRRLIGVSGEIAELAFELPEDVSQAVDRAETMIFEVAQRRTTDTIMPLQELLSQSLDRLEELYGRGESITGVPTGFHELDEHLAGLQPSNLLVVGARPSMGKTAFALGIAANAAVQGIPVLFFSLEMSHLEIAQRVLCAEARVDAARMRNGRLLEGDWPKISNAIGRIGNAPLHIDDNPNVTVMDIRARARRMKARDGLGLVVVDYLQLMTGRSAAENRQVEISEISRGLKILARELEIPVLALSQLSRNLESRADKRPMLADLRECLAGDTRITRSDTNEEVTIGELARSGEKNIPVWSLDEHYRLVRAVMTEAWSTGVKPVFQIRFASGRIVRATQNHPFLTLSGWTPVDHLDLGCSVASARVLGDRNRAADVTDFGAEPMPLDLWDHVRSKAGAHTGLSQSELCERLLAIGVEDGAALSRAQLGRLAVELSDPWLRSLAVSDVTWDQIIEIRALGDEEVFDAYVPTTHSFLANGVVSHNSGAIEQDADVVMFIYRDEVYNSESSDRGSAEILVAKHRNGPTGTVELAFVGNYARFANMARV